MKGILLPLFMVIVKGGKASALSKIKRAVIPSQFVGRGRYGWVGEEASFHEDYQPPTVYFLSFEDLLSRDGFYSKRLRLQILHLRLLSSFVHSWNRCGRNDVQ